MMAKPFERRKELIISRYGPKATSSQWCAAIAHLQQVGLRLIVASSATSRNGSFAQSCPG